MKEKRNSNNCARIFVLVSTMLSAAVIFQIRGASLHWFDTTRTLESLVSKGQKRNVTFVIHLAGELGNHLGYITRGLYVAELAKDEYDIEPTIVFKQQTNPIDLQVLEKSNRTEFELKKCFPSFRNFDMKLGNSPWYFDLVETQESLNVTNHSMLDGLRKGFDGIRSALRHVHDLSVLVPQALKQTNNTPTNDRSQNENVMSLPIINVKGMMNFPIPNNNLSQRILDFFSFDEDSCCKLIPDDDEIVFHYRNFAHEFKLAKKKGFEELSPTKIANELFAGTERDDKVAVVTRFHNDVVSEIKNKLESKGLNVRVIQNQTSLEDFCFLMKTKKELVGAALSTFVKWAGTLGNASIVRQYHVDSVGVREKMGISNSSQLITRSKRIDNPLPAFPPRIRYECYRSEEMEELYANDEAERIYEIDEFVNKTLQIVFSKQNKLQQRKDLA